MKPSDLPKDGAVAALLVAEDEGQDDEDGEVHLVDGACLG